MSFTNLPRDILLLHHRHVPKSFIFGKENPNERIIAANAYNFETGTPTFDNVLNWKLIYRKAKDFLLTRDGKANFCSTFESKMQMNEFSKCPYLPIKLDTRYGMPTNTPLSAEAGFESFETGKSNIAGRDKLTPEYTPTAVLGEMAVQALRRMIADCDKPFSLSVHFNAPHPPMVRSLFPPAACDCARSRRAWLLIVLQRIAL